MILDEAANYSDHRRHRNDLDSETERDIRQQMRALVLLEPRSSSLQAVTEVLERRGYALETASSVGAACEWIHRRSPDVALLDSGIAEQEQLMQELRRCKTRIVILIDPDDRQSHHGNGHAAELHLARPVDPDELDRLLCEEADTQETTRSEAARGNGSNGHTKSRPQPELPLHASAEGFGTLVGTSAQMRNIYEMIGKVAPTNATVFIAGESGTGKELVAEAIHDESNRANKSFVALNCGAIPEGLIDSELFGHEKGAFTGATRARGGVFEQAHGGTLFLDEITEMPIDLQARLLRVLETGRVHRVGSERDVPVDVRVIAASNRPATAALEQGRLREDLLYRLSVFPIQLPPLRDRGGDAVVLANHFLAELNAETGQRRRFSNDALDLIKAYHWPGNVRQVKHAVHRAFILAEEIIDAKYLPSQMERQPETNGEGVQLSVGTSIADAERQLIAATLEHFSGDKKKAAEVLGMSLRTLYNRLNIYKAQQDKGRSGKGRSRESNGLPQHEDHLFA
ncbi:MAG: sigma-54 dependent transcriptional regulator [Phycisphaeraceae bacterium]